SHPGSPRQYPLRPVVDTLLESESNPRTTRLFSETGLGETGLQCQNITLSSRLPPRVWFVLAKCLGIKLSPTDRPIFATFLHVLTLCSAFTFAIPGAWYTFYDIRSEFSKTTVLIGTVELVIGFTWACMGVYAHKLAGRLFAHKNIIRCVRVHSKTFLKISTSWLTIVLAVLVVGLNCYEASPLFHDKACSTALLNDVVCQVFFVGRVWYAFFLLVWNFIIAYVVFSVCRTHTIGIRRFMRELTLDAKAYEQFCPQQNNVTRDNPQSAASPAPVDNVNDLGDSWILWDDVENDMDPADEAVTSHGIFLHSIQSFHRRRSAAQQWNSSYASTRSSVSPREEGLVNSTVGDGSRQVSSDLQNPQNSAGRPLSPTQEHQGDRGVENLASNEGGVVTEEFSASGMFSASQEGNNDADNSGDPFDENTEEKDNEFQASTSPGKGIATAVMTNDDLLFSYWKFMQRLSVTSRFLQRWLASWITFVVIWDGYFVIYWTSHQASLIGILEFIVPLILLLLLCSAYAEVNAEGQRLLTTICPLEERLAVIFYFNQQPLCVKVFSFTVTYNAMMTVILGFSVAFASRMILDEISKP
ncbi:hypothetical protein BaRGS_00005803, partial [Batillaria attramentaria]